MSLSSDEGNKQQFSIIKQDTLEHLSQKLGHSLYIYFSVLVYNSRFLN